MRLQINIILHDQHTLEVSLIANIQDSSIQMQLFACGHHPTIPCSEIALRHSCKKKTGKDAKVVA